MESPRLVRWESLTKKDFDAIDRARASAEIGERILDTPGEHAAGACAEILDGSLGPEDRHSPVGKLRFLFVNPLMIRLSHRLLGFRNGIA